MHSLGFDHEQCRTDRDEFVNINWNNISRGYEDQFAMRNCLAEFLPYDYHSVMHYNAAAFAIDPGIPTIIPRDKTAIRRIGQRVKISKTDCFKINTIYTTRGPDKEARMRKVHKSTNEHHHNIKSHHVSESSNNNVSDDSVKTFYPPLSKANFDLRKGRLWDYTGQENIKHDKKVFKEALRLQRMTEHKQKKTGHKILTNWIRQRCLKRWSTPSLPNSYFPVTKR
ncbi:unnamed protein product [Notodromas monacha]|uniref:Metalloendopeptidase n=1 Tax=Notodromas monacha TaxID=399045 RepID=A0A7R9BQT8_9CRUS|nr:unnamed protein product [Notodromas monacha]CAG0919061.1 unnamed protein product [Notodromas monacha]